MFDHTDPAQDVQPAESHAGGVRPVAVVTDKRLFIALPAAVVLVRVFSLAALV